MTLGVLSALSGALAARVQSARGCGHVRVALAELAPRAARSDEAIVEELFAHAGVRPVRAAPRAMIAVSLELARTHLQRLLLEDMAYGTSLASVGEAAALVDEFLTQTGVHDAGTRYFTNGDPFGEIALRSLDGVAIRSWTPCTDATFDTGVVVVGSRRAGLLWVEDED